MRPLHRDFTNLSLGKKDFRKVEYLIYKVLRLFLLPLGKFYSLRLAVSAHWILKRLAMTLSSYKYGMVFLNAKSSIVEGRLLERYCREGMFIVEAGCGTSRYLPILQGIGVKKYLGLDTSEASLSLSSKVYPQFEFKLSNALETNQIPPCDGLILSHFLEHIENPEIFLQGISSLCELLFVEVPDFSSDPLNFVASSIGGPWWSDPDHQREYSVTSVSKLLQEANFQILELFVHGGTIGLVATPFLSEEKN
jgi:hypothetical protein